MRGASINDTRTDASRMRLQYVEKELRTARTKMQEIGAQETARLPSPGPADIAAVAEREDGEMLNEILSLCTRILELEAQRESAWTLGLSDDAPPGYTA